MLDHPAPGSPRCLLSTCAAALQDMVGKDLSRVCLPVYFNEPLSMLQKLPEDAEYTELIDKVRKPPAPAGACTWEGCARLA